MQPKPDNYRFSCQTPLSASRASEIALNLGLWWGEAEGRLQEVGDRLVMGFPGHKTTWSFELQKLEPGKSIELYCYQAHHLHDDLPETIREEWKDTRLVFHFKPQGESCIVDFEHQGLDSQLDCFEVCVQGWQHYLEGSLRKFLQTT